MTLRTTLAQTVECAGVGLHTGRRVRARIGPGEPGSGRVFVRTDLAGLRIPAAVGTLTTAAYATMLAVDGGTVSTVEHLLSAAVGLGIDDLQVELDGPELPILDGSARPFVDLLVSAGRADSPETLRAIRMTRRLEVTEGEKSLVAEPHPGLRIVYDIDFASRVIGRSHIDYVHDPARYAAEIAPARTFCSLDEVDQLRQAGLAQGGSLENALVVDGDELLNGPLRFPDEFVRHKLLDLIGDLALLERPLLGKVSACRGGHALHGKLAAAILASPDAWELVPAPTAGASLAASA